MGSRWRGFSLLEAVVALTITGLLLGALGSLLIYASRTLSQSVSDSTVQQQGVVALRKVSDDLIQSNIYSLYSVNDPGSNHLAAVANGLNVTFLSPQGVSSQAGAHLFSFGASHHLQFNTWVGYSVDSSKNLIRYDKKAAPGIEVSSPPATPLASPTLLTDFTGMPVGQQSNHTLLKGIVTQDPNGAPITDGFAITPIPAVGGRAVNLTIRVQDFFTSKRFQQLDLTTQVFLRNTE